MDYDFVLGVEHFGLRAGLPDYNEASAPCLNIDELGSGLSMTVPKILYYRGP